MSLSTFVHALGRGPSKSRNLSREEAAEAMGLILSGQAEPEAVGALLMLMRYRGETAEEIAGFVDAIRASLSGWDTPMAVLDWPSYAAGRSRGLPWFLLSAKLVAKAGHPVLLHGWNSHQNPLSSVRKALSKLDISVCTTPERAVDALSYDGIGYVPVEAFHPELLRLLKLRDVLGLRSPVNTVLRALNPTSAVASVQGVFHPSYRGLQQDTAAILEQKHLAVIKGGGGEFECNPSKDTELFGLRNSVSFEEAIPSALDGARRLSSASSRQSDLFGLWSGAHSDDFTTAIVTGTAALALETIDPDLDRDGASRLAQDLWTRRHQRIAA